MLCVLTFTPESYNNHKPPMGKHSTRLRISYYTVLKNPVLDYTPFLMFTMYDIILTGKV